MKVTLRIQEQGKGNSFRYVMCPCCKQKHIFPSFKQASEHAKELGAIKTKIQRIDL